MSEVAIEQFLRDLDRSVSTENFEFVDALLARLDARLAPVELLLTALVVTVHIQKHLHYRKLFRHHVFDRLDHDCGYKRATKLLEDL